MKDIPDKYFDVVYIDPPYFNVKGDFDKLLTFPEWLDLHENVARESCRILKDNGSVILWGDAANIAYQQIIFDKYFNLLNSCVWKKSNGRGHRLSADSLRTFAPVTERFLFYDKGEDKSGLTMIMSNPDLFKSIKQYMRGEREKIMIHHGMKTVEEFNIYIREITGTSSVVDHHYFADSQYVFPTLEIYAKLQTTGFFRREYEELRREYEELRREYEELRRPFDLKTSRLRFDVIEWPIDSHITGKYNHPTQKPYTLTIEIIKTISRERDKILIPFSGSGTEAVASWDLFRDFLAIEKDEDYYKASVERLEILRSQGVLF
ncbi:MAG TPA: site-specific DNA-methyltransferase [Spirochaetota bacterium]|nr:site-specific DNA-methyltransferase [Spirochaetota bacterium]